MAEMSTTPTHRFTIPTYLAGVADGIVCRGAAPAEAIERTADATLTITMPAGHTVRLFQEDPDADELEVFVLTRSGCVEYACALSGPVELVSDLAARCVEYEAGE